MTSTCTLAWQVWHLWHWAGSGSALGFRCGAGTPRLLAWQPWHLETSIFVSLGRSGARAQLAHTQLAHTQLVITPLAHTQLVVTQLTLAWQVWHLWHWAGSGGALGFRCGAGTPRLLAWQAWHLETSIFVHNLLWRGRCGTYGTGLALVARLVLGVAPGRHGCWRGKRGTYGTGLALVARLVLGVAPGCRGCWRGRRGTWRHPSSFHLAGVVLGDIDWACTSAASLALLRTL